jgi:DNA-binding NarL/FixJ family response regulator
MTRIILADDHTLFRAGLRQMLHSQRELAVVAEATNAKETIEAVKNVAADLLILDLTMPGAAGTGLIAQVVAECASLPVLVLSMHDEPVTVRRALSAGAAGYITKESSPDTLITAISCVAEGNRYIAPDVAQSLALESLSIDRPSRHMSLSRREWEVLRLISHGLPLSQIAERLNLSPKTITTHKTHLMEKLGVHNNADLIRYAIEQKLFE